MHEYKITNFSLYAAVSLGMTLEEIRSNLVKWSKVELPAEILTFVERFTTRYGKVKLLLQRNGYIIESQHDDILEELLQDETIATAYMPTQIMGLPPPDPSLGSSFICLLMIPSEVVMPCSQGPVLTRQVVVDEQSRPSFPVELDVTQLGDFGDDDAPQVLISLFFDRAGVITHNFEHWL